MSQSFLVAKGPLERIAGALALTPGETVVELGPGVGTLTQSLLDAGARVVAVELDRDMCRVLATELGDTPAFEVVQGDAAHVDLRAIAERRGASVALTGNLPYAATGAIFRNLIAHRDAVSRAVVTVQREVRDRLRAEPGSRDYGALTVFIAAVFDVEPLFLVKAGSFHPPPRVQSAVVRLVPRAQPRARETSAFQQVVRAVFDARRKTLRNALLQIAGGDTHRVDTVLQRCDIDGRHRGETLSVESFDALARAWEATAL